MKVTVQRLRRSGIPLKRGQREPPLEGEVAMRMMSTAHESFAMAVFATPEMRNPDQYRWALFEPKLVGLGHGGMQLRGFEREREDGPTFAQEWVLEVVTRG